MRVRYRYKVKTDKEISENKIAGADLSGISLLSQLRRQLPIRGACLKINVVK